MLHITKGQWITYFSFRSRTDSFRKPSTGINTKIIIKNDERWPVEDEDSWTRGGLEDVCSVNKEKDPKDNSDTGE